MLLLPISACSRNYFLNEGLIRSQNYNQLVLHVSIKLKLICGLKQQLLGPAWRTFDRPGSSNLMVNQPSKHLFWIKENVEDELI